MLSGFNAASSFGAHGYQKFGNGLIIQWGQASVSANGQNVKATFPITFPNACLQVTRAERYSGAVWNYCGFIQSWDSTGVYATNWVAPSTWHYIAIGY